MTENERKRKEKQERNQSLIQRAQAGDEAAAESLVEENMGLVRSIAQRFADRGTEMEDLMQIGVMGMLKAVKSFDFSYQTAFSTYAVPLIIGEIRRFLRDDGMIKVGREIKKRGAEIQRAKEEFFIKHGREGTSAELAAVLHMSAEDFIFSLDANAPVHSLSEPIGADSEDYTLENSIADKENFTERLTDRLSLMESIKKLSEEEQKIIALRYFRDLSQQQTADILGLTQVKVSRSEKKIFAFLRQELTACE